MTIETNNINFVSVYSGVSYMLVLKPDSGVTFHCAIELTKTIAFQNSSKLMEFKKIFSLNTYK